MIEKRRPRRRKPRINKNRPPSQLRTFETKGVSTPKTRGAISKALEKYTSLAQDAFSNGDRIVAESYYQFAEHYQRVLNENFQDDKPENVNPQLQKDNGIDVKPSRTERALNAKNERTENFSSNNQQKLLDSSKVNDNNSKQQGKDGKYTSDGIEALKPFEV